MPAYALHRSNEARIKALSVKHSQISDFIEEMEKQPSTADYYLKQLKKQKLILKDTIVQLRDES